MEDHISELRRKIMPEGMIDHSSYTHNLIVKLRPAKKKKKKNSGLNRVWTHDLCDAGAVF